MTAFFSRRRARAYPEMRTLAPSGETAYVFASEARGCA